ncbi:MAG: tetratricopeptide repeat protein [Terracidiphilus sp.]
MQQLQNLAAAQRWSDIVASLSPVPVRSAEMDFYQGIALAQLGRLTEAQTALETGRRLAPADPRFSVELAGIAFRQKDYPLAVRRMRRALRLNPGDSYANDFLGTVYFLEGNLEAALKYWNRVGKPYVANTREDPKPRISAALLDQAFAFSPASTLTLPQFQDSAERLRGLGVFPQFHFDLSALPGGEFDLIFRARELDGFGDSKVEALLRFFQGAPFQEVNPSFYNLHREAINFNSMFRWDAQKRRIFVDFSGPFEHGAKERWQLTTDLRSENWAIRNGSAGPAPVLASFNMRQVRLAFDLASNASARLGWSLGAEVSHGDFRSVAPGAVSGSTPTPVLTPQMLATGYQLKQRAQFSSTLWSVPERRFALSARAASDAARLWSQPAETFEKLAASLGWHWFPQAKGDDYETSQQLRAGCTFGQVPFDELFILGLERDNDLPLRAHIGTRDGRKGSAPLGRNYLLENWETNKNIYGNGIVELQVGPFFDFGKITDIGTDLGSHQWLFDTGLQAKLRVFGTGLIFSYGKDLRTGNNAFYLTPFE